MQSNYLTPQVIASLANLELQAKQVVEGFISGLHKSPFHGFSVEFSQHRPYLPGDSLRFIDWKVNARTDRYYIKQFEQETNLRSHILLDISKSMQFGAKAMNKFQYASALAASLAYLLIRQKDAVGLSLFDSKIRSHLTPRSVRSFLPQIYSELEKAIPGEDTHISSVLHEIADKIHRRSLVIIISDLFDDPDEVLKGLRHFRHDLHEVLVFHLMDPHEMAMDYSGEVVFKDLESGERIKTQAAYIRESYQEKINEFLEHYRVECSNNQISYQLIQTDMSFDKALTQFFLKRKRLI